MRVIRILVPGDWRDGWIYKDSIYLVDRSNSFFCAPVREALNAISADYGPASTLAAEALVFRSGDWKNSALFERAVALRSTRLEILDVPDIVIPDGIFRPVSTLNLDSYLYDFKFYANRVYMASEEGLFESRVDPDHPWLAADLSAGAPVPATAIAANYGLLLASAGEDGLWQSHIDFGFDSPISVDDSKLKRLADNSSSASFARHNVINYAIEDGRSTTELYRGETITVPRSLNQKFESVRIESLKSPLRLDHLDDRPKHGAKRKGAVERPVERLHIVANHWNTLLAQQKDEVQVVNLTVAKNENPRLNVRDRWASEETKREMSVSLEGAHSIQGVKSGFVIERDDTLALFSRHGSVDLLKEAVGRVRTFPDSQRVTDTVFATTNAGCLFMGYKDLESN
ncbi:hypothetical protein [Blastococcus sp. SYSU DS0619]